ncbi:MAG TPA: glycosyltransferase family 2 protein [Candidatus Omnitrophica bacterium]|nr:glycosyltransferase family 2 protein [Candidatus Omnitrophota bacterium]
MMQSVILIPAYNEEKNIGSIIADLNEINPSEIVVIDDGSQDRTAEVARRMGAKVLRLDRNYGKGRALKKGLEYVLHTDASVVFIMDADGQHRAEDVLKLYNHYKKFRPDVIVGNRMNNPWNMPVIRRVTNWIMSKIISIMCRTKIPDSQCGLKLFSRKVIEKVNITSRKFEVESELLLKAAREGFKIDSVDISSVYFPERKSRIRPFPDTIRFIKFTIKYWFYREF